MLIYDNKGHLSDCPCAPNTAFPHRPSKSPGGRPVRVSTHAKVNIKVVGCLRHAAAHAQHKTFRVQVALTVWHMRMAKHTESCRPKSLLSRVSTPQTG
jgi:hypothetical protein